MLKDHVGPLMSSHGYLRRRQGTYEKRNGDCVATVRFQRSVHNTKESVEFTINLSVLNEAIMEAFYDTVRRLYEQGHKGNVADLRSGGWTSRIGHLMSEPHDHWWKLSLGEPTQPVVASVLESLERIAIPRIEEEMDRPISDPAFVILFEDETA